MYRSSRQDAPTFALIAVNVAVYVYTCFLSGNLTTSDSVIKAFGQDNYAVLNGEVWRLFTAMFIHFDILHILGNMLFLFIFGLRAENMFDVREYMLIYFASGLFGGLLTLVFLTDVLSIGASGAIFGVIGATMVYGRRSMGQLASGLMSAFFLLLINSIGPDVNYFAHIGGLAAGLLIGYALWASRRPTTAVTYKYAYPGSWGNAATELNA